MEKVKSAHNKVTKVCHDHLIEHKHFYLVSLSVAVLGLHYLSPEIEVFGYALIGVITAKLT